LKELDSKQATQAQQDLETATISLFHHSPIN
jgi:hypothetical protein